MESSQALGSRRFPPNSDPSAPAPVADLRLSVSPPVLGEVERRVGLKASLSLPTGETPRLWGVVVVVSMVSACLGETSSADVSESTRVASVVVAAESMESTVSEVIKGEESVRSPACDWCGEMPGRRTGGLIGRLVGTERAC